MEIPEAIRKELLEAGGIMTPEDFSNLIYDLNKKAKKSKKSSVSAVSNAVAVGAPRTKFTYLCTKTTDMIRGNRSLVDEFKSAGDNKKRMVLIMREAEEMVGEELKNVFCRKLARANKNHAIVKEEGNFYFKKENYTLALDMYSTVKHYFSVISVGKWGITSDMSLLCELFLCDM